ncbi:MAG: NAD(P)-dependent dehydrogenase (short-subunit alcohol dehydrogenase family) [Paraglaciecola sp.]|jgi:NAD(P)-dependent dehydrogenase (short-subunit alcohol dehydrogenase family)
MNNYQPSKNFLADKTILVTGAGDGIGKEAALHYAKYGATVILLGKTVPKLEAVYDQIIAAGGAEPAIIPLDLAGATVKHYQDMAATIDNQFATLDGVLHNASMLGHLEPFAQITDSDWHQVMQVNLNSQFFMTQALLPVLKKSPNASMIFTTSSVGLKGRAYWGSYAISKFATQGMMEVLADEYENSNMRFNCINPGGTRTKMRAQAFPAEDVSKLKTAADIMPLYLYLMSKDSHSETGKTFHAQPK